MAITIPDDFDVNAQLIDPNESFIRDQLQLHVGNWVRFRHTINVGVSSANLHRRAGGAVSASVAEAYRELGKSHYEVVTSLGSAKLLLDAATAALGNHHLVFKTTNKALYFHMGCLLDNLARLVYIVNDPASDTAMRGRRLMRHWIDWGSLPDYAGYTRIKRSEVLLGIVNIRNTLAHGWRCPARVDTHTGIIYWPTAVRRKRDFYWPYDEMKPMNRAYRGYVPVQQMMMDDFRFIEMFQDQVFAKLVRDIRKFERNYGVEIR